MTTHDDTFDPSMGSDPGADPDHDAPESTTTAPEVGTSTTGLAPNVAAALAYGLGWLSGLGLWLVERDSPFVRFHAIQSTIFFGGVHLLNLVFWKLIPLSVLGGLFLWPIFLVVWAAFIFKAYKGEQFKLPYIGDWADERAQIP